MNFQTRREFLKAMGLATISAGVSSIIHGCTSLGQTQSDKTSNGKKPNIVYIMCDDHAWQAMSCYGSKINKTPNLDRIAKEGMQFNRCFCTNSICAPSRAVILTGQYSHINGVPDNSTIFDPQKQTFPKLLQKEGYQTAMIGKWHLESDPQGFDYWNVLPGQGAYYNPDFIEMGQKKIYTGYVTDIITDLTLEWLKKCDKTKPFLLMYQHKAPHRSWLPGPKYLTMYDDVTIPEPDTLFDDYSTRSKAARQQKMTIAKDMMKTYDLKVLPPESDFDKRAMSWDGFDRMNEEQRKAWDAAYEPKNEEFKKANLKGKDLVRWKYQRYIKDYLRCVASVDDNVGRVLDYLDANGLTENTVVVYTSDQGFYLGEHGWFDKRFMYEESFKMPFLVKYPKEIKAGSTNSNFVMNLDFAPTFLDFAGIKKPDDMQGRSIRPLLDGKTPKDWRKSIYYHYYEYPAVHSVKRHYGVRTEQYKLIHFYYDIDAWELYDLKKDPHEINNVYDNPAYAGIVKQLKTELRKLQKQYGDSDELAQQILQNDAKKHNFKLVEK